MRQLKLRVWGKSELGQPLRKLIYSDEFQDYNENDRMYWFFKYLSDQEIEFDEYQLFTGLRDKNGNDIYEGDILSSENNKLYNKIDVVRFINSIGAFMISLNNKDRHIPLYPFTYESFIIGNIHENPELLKDNK